MGVFATRSAHAWASTQPPNDTSGKLWRTFLGGGQFPDQFSHIFFTPNLILLWVKTPYNILEPCNNPFWEKSNPSARKKEERERKRCNSEHLVLWQRMQVPRTNSGHYVPFATPKGSARTLLRPVSSVILMPCVFKIFDLLSDEPFYSKCTTPTLRYSEYRIKEIKESSRAKHSISHTFPNFVVSTSSLVHFWFHVYIPILK